MKLPLDIDMQISHYICMTTHVTYDETSFICQLKDKVGVVGLMHNVEMEHTQGFTIKANMIQQVAI